MLVEACVTTCTEAISSWRAGAHRLELCEHLEVDGLTPSLALLKQIRAEVPIPIRVMVRPRAGTFCMTATEVQVMQAQMQELGAHGADGFVLGVTTPNGEVDFLALETLVAAAKGIPVTFHRAFDGVVQKAQALAEFRDLGVASVLTSGGSGTAWLNRRALTSLCTLSQGHPEIILAGSVRGDHVAQLIRETGAAAIHARASAIPEITIALKQSA